MTKYYVTTPIYYPNDVPHIGHAYTTIVADVLARWHSAKGDEVFFLTGTDDHGKKIADTAKKAGKNPKEFTDALVPKFKDAWKKLNIDYDRFIRTTDNDHEKVVQEVLQKVYDNGDIYKGEYEGFYCTGCEAYYTEKDLTGNGECPIHKTKIEKLKEESYFFKLSKYKKQLLNLYKKHPEFVLPNSKRNEVVSRVKEDLRDLSISRNSFDWGIPLPFDREHVCYVWFDALFNYYSGVKGKDEKFWPANIHLIGKDILWFHAVYWPAFLISAGIKELPTTVFAHGWWTFDKEKISKSRGKIINVDELISIAGVDAARYFLLRATPFGDDGDFSEKALIDRYNNELADKLGNLVSRVAGLIERHGTEKSNNKLIKKLKEKEIDKYVENFEFDKALNLIFSFVDNCNEYVQKNKIWEAGCMDREKKLFELKESILKIAELLWPFIPSSAEKIKKQFSSKNIKKGEVLFRKVEGK
jgi:methionyl-tRNA synthetase